MYAASFQIHEYMHMYRFGLSGGGSRFHTRFNDVWVRTAIGGNEDFMEEIWEAVAPQPVFSM
jgi:hypothetical protein